MYFIKFSYPWVLQFIIYKHLEQSVQPSYLRLLMKYCGLGMCSAYGERNHYQEGILAHFPTADFD